MIKYQGLKTLEVLEGADNYNKWIADSISKFVMSPVLEIGSGIGTITINLLHNKPFVASEKDSGLVKLLTEKFSSKKGVLVRSVDIERRSSGNIVGSFKTVFAVNVLEHIKDDESAFKNIYNLLAKDGRVILLVPANKFAYTSLDRKLGHFRRYSKDEMITKLESAGFKIETIKYFNMLGLLTWLIRDMIDSGSDHLSKSHIRLFDKIVPMLKFIESYIPAPFGISIFVVAKRVEKNNE